jgi:hypothetical protein
MDPQLITSFSKLSFLPQATCNKGIRINSEEGAETISTDFPNFGTTDVQSIRTVRNPVPVSRSLLLPNHGISQYMLEQRGLVSHIKQFFLGVLGFRFFNDLRLSRICHLVAPFK